MPRITAIHLFRMYSDVCRGDLSFCAVFILMKEGFITSRFNCCYKDSFKECLHGYEYQNFTRSSQLLKFEFLLQTSVAAS